MNFSFGFNDSVEFRDALDKTLSEFESMTGSELLDLGAKHANGVIANFLAQSSDSGMNPEAVAIHELSFVFDSPDSKLKSFVASFEMKQVLKFDNGYQTSAPCAYTESRRAAYDGAGFLAGVATMVSAGAMCQAA